jgi:hypothetical protein
MEQRYEFADISRIMTVQTLPFLPCHFCYTIYLMLTCEHTCLSPWTTISNIIYLSDGLSLSDFLSFIYLYKVRRLIPAVFVISATEYAFES